MVVSTAFLIPAANAAAGWNPTTNYPKTIEAGSCVVDAATIFCVGGTPNYDGPAIADANMAPWMANGKVKGPNWVPTTPYHNPIALESCVVSGISASSQFIYCVGGQAGGTVYAAVWSAPISAAGIGTWTMATNSYPMPIFGESCFAYLGYLICVGGETVGSTYVNNVYSAHYINGVVGAWTAQTHYPLTGYALSCVKYFDYAYCVGGYNGASTNAVYSAQLTLNGGITGAGWSVQAHHYLLTVDGESCVVRGNKIYCVGGYTGGGNTNLVYDAKLVAGTVGAWTNAAPPSISPYPTTVSETECVNATATNHIACVGGVPNGGQPINSVYYYP